MIDTTFLYLFINIIIVSSPFVAKLIYKPTTLVSPIIAFYSIFPIALGFIFFDALVTNYFWYFNTRYITGLFIGPLPLEEILFFFSVPYACLILWEHIRTLNIYNKIVLRGTPYASIVLLTSVFIALWLFFNAKWYSLTMFVPCSVLLLRQLQRGVRISHIAFMVLVTFLTTIFNGVLTGIPVVLYNPVLNTGLRIGTIPIEDYLFGYILIALVVQRYNKFT